MTCPAAKASGPILIFDYGTGIFGRPVACFLTGGDYYLYGVTQGGDPRILPSIRMAREIAASALIG